MTDKANQKSKSLWLILAGCIILALAFYLSRDNGTDLVPNDPAGETPSEPQLGDLTPPDKTADPIDPVEEATALVNKGSVTIAELAIGMGSGEAENVIERLLKPKTSEGNQTYDMRLTPQTQNGYTLIAVADNMMDDSVKAQEVTAMFRPGQRDAFILSEYTVRVQCRRGAKVGQWQTERCQ